MAAESLELADLLSPAAYTKTVSDTELISSSAESRSVINLVEDIFDVLLAIPRKIIAFIRRLATAVYSTWVLVFRNIFSFYGGVFTVIAQIVSGIINFYKELFGIYIGVFKKS